MIQEVVEQVEHTVRDLIGSNIHTAMPGQILSYDAELGQCEVQPVGSYYCSGFEMEYPVISGVPVVMPCSAEGVGFCFPIREGDSCLLVFSEQSMSAWMTETSEAQSDERFELQNCIAIPGLARVSAPAQMVANEENCAVVAAGETMLKVSPEGVEISGDTRIKGDVRITGQLWCTGNVHAPNIEG